MNEKQKHVLNQILSENDVYDPTEAIRHFKHSQIIRKEVQTLQTLMEEYKDDPEGLEFNCTVDCAFLHTYFNDLLQKLKSGEYPFHVLYHMLDRLRDVEEGKKDNHEASFQTGNLLIDSYVKPKLAAAASVPKHKISWKEYKYLHSSNSKKK